MKLQEFLSKHPHVSLATVSDNESILAFFDSFPMTGKGLRLQYQRSPDFFAFLEMHSYEYFVFLLKENETIQGVGTLVIHDGFINGNIVPVGYLGDLRVRPGKRNAVNWRNFYRDLMASSSTIEELHGARHFITAVIDSNINAQRALVESKKNSFSYHPLSTYQMINVFGKRPWPKIKSDIEVRRARPSDLGAIKNYWRQEEARKQFGKPDLLEHSLKTWDGFSIEDLVVAFKEDQMVGLCGLWYPGRTKRIVIKALPWSMRLLTGVLKMRRCSFPSLNQELKPLYLTHLNYSDPSVLEQMLNFILKLSKAQDHHMVSLTAFPAMKTTQALKAFLYEDVPMCLYQVYDKENSDVIVDPGSRPPGFEMALV